LKNLYRALYIVINCLYKQGVGIFLNKVYYQELYISIIQYNSLYCMNRVFCVMTATLILHVFKNTLDELPDCSYRHFVFSIHIYSLLKYLIIQYSFIYSQLNIKNESNLCVSLFFEDYMYINGKYDGIILFFLQRKVHLALKR
jgi:hypothetical protein